MFKWLSRSFLAAALTLGVVVAGLYFWPTGGGAGASLLRLRAPGEEEPADDAGTEEPLFEFSSDYHRGRSLWFAEAFRRDRERVAALDAPAEPLVSPIVHREPFTQGAWLQSLSDDLRQARTDVESQTVETTVLFHVPGISPGNLAVFLAYSGFRETLPDGSRFEFEYYLPPLVEPPEGLVEPPALKPNQYLTREKWSSKLARPTDAYLIHEIRAEGDVVGLIYETWQDNASADHAPIRLASGQYSIVAKGEGTLVLLRSFYSGQTVPPLMDAIVVGMTRSFYRKLCAHVQQMAAAWEPDEAVQAWREPLGL